MATHSRAEAVRSLAKFLGITETRAGDLLADPEAYGVEIRARNGVTAAEARRELERRYRSP
jgi:hypothetical protein